MDAMQFERLGIFAYSQEEGSPAAALPNQIPQEIKERRLEQAMLLQQKISLGLNRRFIGKTFEVLVEGKHEKDPHVWVGRSYMDAPEVDGNVMIKSRKQLKTGEFYPVRITDVEEYDLVGEY